MRESKPTETQSVGILKPSIAEYRVPMANLLREFEAQNAKLKRMHADLALENGAITDVT